MTTLLELPTVFHVTHYKSGSQWVYNILQASAPERIIPPRNEVAHFLGQAVIPGMIYPTLYVTRDEFDSVEKPIQHIKFVTMRDLRDTIVSWYFSASKSHRESPNLLQVRPKLNTKGVVAGLRDAMLAQGPSIAAFQMSWMNSDALIVRYEDLLEDELLYFRRIINHCQIPVSDHYLEQIVHQFSFQKRSGRSRGNENNASHLRKGVHGDWANYLYGELLGDFKEYFDHVLIATGYEKNRDWGLDLLPKLSPGIELRQKAPETMVCWCGHDGFDVFSGHYKRCTRCGTLVHKKAFGKRFYDVTETTAAGTFMKLPDASTDSNSLHLQARQVLSRKDTVTKFKLCLNYLEPGAKVLEINAQTGVFVMLLRQAGFDAMGLNPHPISREHVNFQQEVLEVPMFYGSLEWQNIADGSLDAIILTQILQDVADLNVLIAYCNQWLKPDGKLIIQDYILSDTRTYAAMQEAGSTALYPIMLNTHQHIFTDDSIEQLLMENGYLESVTMPLPHPSLTLREKYVDKNMYETYLIASRSPFVYHPAAEEELYSIGTGYTLHALMDMYRELALSYHTIEVERDSWLEQVEQMTTVSPAQLLQVNTIQTGTGWYSGEVAGREKFSWVGNDAELIIFAPSDKRFDMYLELEPGPAVREAAMSLVVTRADGLLVHRFDVAHRQKLFLHLPVEIGKRNVFVLHVENGGLQIQNDPRILNFRVFEMGSYTAVQDVSVPTLQAAQDIIAFGAGWYPIEMQHGRRFRWANNLADIIIFNASGRYNRIVMDVHAGPSLKQGVFQLELLDSEDCLIAEQTVRGKGIHSFELPLEPQQDYCFRLRVEGGGLPVPNDPRILNFRVFGIGWSKE